VEEEDYREAWPGNSASTTVSLSSRNSAPAAWREHVSRRLPAASWIARPPAKTLSAALEMELDLRPSVGRSYSYVVDRTPTACYRR